MTAAAQAADDESLLAPLKATSLWLHVRDAAINGIYLAIAIEMSGIDKRDNVAAREERIATLRDALELARAWNVFAGEIPRRPPPTPTPDPVDPVDLEF